MRKIFSYIQGTLRYNLFYSRFSSLIPTHISEQIECRINSMDKECYDNGSCKMCGCKTTALQMANKQCDKPCYPRMFTKDEWKVLNRVRKLHIDNRSRGAISLKELKEPNWKIGIVNNKFQKA